MRVGRRVSGEGSCSSSSSGSRRGGGSGGSIRPKGVSRPPPLPGQPGAPDLGGVEGGKREVLQSHPAHHQGRRISLQLAELLEHEACPENA